MKVMGQICQHWFGIYSWSVTGHLEKLIERAQKSAKKG